MSLSRVKPNILLPIRPKPCTSTHFRCLRTKPNRQRPLPPLQGAFGLPDGIREKVKRLRFPGKREEDPNKISIVPKEPGQTISTETIGGQKKLWEDMTEEEIAEARRLSEQEKRIEEFETEKRELSREEIDKRLYERTTGKSVDVEAKRAETEEEKAEKEVFRRDIIGRKFKKPKTEYKIDLWATRSYVRFTKYPENQKRMAQAAAEIIQTYHRHMHGDKLGDMLNGSDSAALQLPEGLLLQDVDTRHLALPFPPRAILPTMRLIFSEMKDQVRFALSDQQVNSIATGVDFIKHLINPPRRAINPQKMPQLYSELVKIPFPVNVVILPDKRLEKRRLEKAESARVRSIQWERETERKAMLKMEMAKKEADRAKEEEEKETEERELLEKDAEKKRQEEREEKEQREQAKKAIAEEEKRKDRFHNFYGRVS